MGFCCKDPKRGGGAQEMEEKEECPHVISLLPRRDRWRLGVPQGTLPFVPSNLYFPLL